MTPCKKTKQKQNQRSLMLLNHKHGSSAKFVEFFTFCFFIVLGFKATVTPKPLEGPLLFHLFINYKIERKKNPRLLCFSFTAFPPAGGAYFNRFLSGFFEPWCS